MHTLKQGLQYFYISEEMVMVCGVNGCMVYLQEIGRSSTTGQHLTLQQLRHPNATVLGV